VLLAVRVAIASVSGSLSIIVTTLDAVLDVISGVIIWSTSAAKRQRNKYRFPIGQVPAPPSHPPQYLFPSPAQGLAAQSCRSRWAVALVLSTG
jgi:hypothetical protein